MAGGILVTLLLVSCLYVTYGLAANIKHNLKVGRKGPNDVILYQGLITKSSPKPLERTSVVIKYPTKKIPRRTPVITQINAIDLYGYDVGGYATILRGGIGKHSVTIRFKSQKGRGMKFFVTIHGHY